MADEKYSFIISKREFEEAAKLIALKFADVIDDAIEDVAKIVGKERVIVDAVILVALKRSIEAVVCAMNEDEDESYRMAVYTIVMAAEGQIAQAILDAFNPSEGSGSSIYESSAISASFAVKRPILHAWMKGLSRPKPLS